MAMPSTHYRELIAGVRTLRKHLLPGKFDPNGNYRERVFTGVVAFRVLSHAAIEEYFENRAIEIAVSALKACQNSGKISRPALTLLGFSGTELRLPPDTIDPTQPSKTTDWASEIDIDQKLNDCVTSFIRRLKNDNHGVLERNILSVLLPVGIKPGDIDRLFLSDMNDFGKTRGEYAHTAPKRHTTKKPNPEIEFRRVSQLVGQIRPIDGLLDQLLKAAQ
ncbi:MAG TPA: hypothetical protein VIL84_01750 [Devosiaceae bacterium]